MKRFFKKISIPFLLVFLLTSFFLFYKFGQLPSDVEELAQMFSSFLILTKVNKNIPGQENPMAIARDNVYFSTLPPSIQEAYQIHAFSNPLQCLFFIGSHKAFKFLRWLGLFTISPDIVGKYALTKLRILPASAELSKAYFLLASSNAFVFLDSPFIAVMFLSAILGLLTVALIYYLAKKAYGTKEAVLSSLLFVTSYFFLIEVRGAWLQHVFNLFIATFAIVSFYLLHLKKQWRYFFLAAFSIGFVGVAGYNAPFVVPLIFLGFFLLNIDYKSYGLGFLFLVCSLVLISFEGWKFLPLILLIFLLPNPTAKLSDILQLVRRWLKLQIIPLFKSNQLLGLGKYLALIVAAGLVYLLFITSYSSHYSFSRWEVLDSIKKFPAATRGLTPMGEWDYKSELILNTRFLIRGIFIKMIKPRETLFVPPIYRAGITHYTQVMPGKPMIAPLVTLFFILGLFWARKDKLWSDKLIVPWAVIPLLVYGVYLGFQPRYLLIATPGIYLLAARGLVRAETKLKSKLQGWKKPLVAIVFAFFILWTIYSHCQTYFGYYAQNDGFLTGNFGQHQMAEYILTYGFPERQEVVLGEKSMVGYDNFYFNTAGRPYRVDYWDNLLWGFIDEERNRDVASLANQLIKWEKEVLEEKERIFYVFSIGPHFFEMPGESAPGQSDLATFMFAHFGLEPEKTIYHSSGVPALAIYIVNKKTPSFEVKTETVEGDGKGKFSAGNHFSGFAIEGRNLEQLEIKTIPGSSSLTSWLKNLPNLKSFEINFEGRAQVAFSPFTDQADLINFSQRENVDYYPTPRPGNDHCIASQGKGKDSFFIYEIELPFEIKLAKVRSELRMFNDKKKKNAAFGYYSLDSSNYQKLFELRSDGEAHYDYGVDEATRWTAVKKKGTYNYLPLNSKKLYLKFALQGEENKSLVCTPLWITLDLDLGDEFKENKPTKLEVLNPNSSYSITVTTIFPRSK